MPEALSFAEFQMLSRTPSGGPPEALRRRPPPHVRLAGAPLPVEVRADHHDLVAEHRVAGWHEARYVRGSLLHQEVRTSPFSPPQRIQHQVQQLLGVARNPKCPRGNGPPGVRAPHVENKRHPAAQLPQRLDRP